MNKQQTNTFDKFMRKLKFRKKRAVSPVIAIVLLIALTVSVTAIVWAITTGLIGGPNTEVIIEDYDVADTDVNGLGDLIVLKSRNIGSDPSEISDITLTRDGTALDSWVLLEETYTIGPQQVEIIELQTIVSQDEVNNNHTVIVSFKDSGDSITEQKIDVSSNLASIPVFYGSGSGFSNVDINAEGWVSYSYQSHGGSGNGIYVQQDDIYFDTNDDILFYLQRDNKRVKNAVITAQFEYGDNDGIGIAFRIVDALNYYWIGITEDHNGPENRFGESEGSTDGPYFQNDGHFELHKIVDGVDTLITDAVPTSFSLIPGSAQNPTGPYFFRISFTDNSFDFDAKYGSSGTYEEILSATDTQFENSGYFGVFSVAAEDSRLNTFTVTSS